MFVYISPLVAPIEKLAGTLEHCRTLTGRTGASTFVCVSLAPVFFLSLLYIYTSPCRCHSNLTLYSGWGGEGVLKTNWRRNKPPGLVNFCDPVYRCITHGSTRISINPEIHSNFFFLFLFELKTVFCFHLHVHSIYQMSTRARHTFSLTLVTHTHTPRTGI